MRGIDISNWQRGFNLSEASVDFAIFKATGGNSYVDPTCNGFVQQAKKAGKLWGFYHFAKDGCASQDGAKEADFFMSKTTGYWGSGLPVLDLEDNGILDWAAYTKAFVNRIYEKKNVYPVIYTGLTGIARLKGTGVLEKCKVWFAGYPLGYINYWLSESATPRNYYSIDNAAQIIMWQFTSAVPIQGFNVDANLCYISKAEWNKLVKGSGQVTPSTPTESEVAEAMAMTAKELEAISKQVWSYRNKNLEKVDAYAIMRRNRDSLAKIEKQLTAIGKKLDAIAKKL